MFESKKSLYSPLLFKVVLGNKGLYLM